MSVSRHFPPLPEAVTIPVLILGSCSNVGNALVHPAFPSSAPQPPKLEVKLGL